MKPEENLKAWNIIRSMIAQHVGAPYKVLGGSLTKEEIQKAFEVAEKALNTAVARSKVKGHMVEVPVTLTIAVRGSQTEEEAVSVAEAFFAKKLQRIADDNHGEGWRTKGCEISEVSLERWPQDRPTKILDTLNEVDGTEVWSDDEEVSNA